MIKNKNQSLTLLSLFTNLIIFFAGFTFLIYEVSWNRILSLVLGTTVSAATIVLISFMAGFGTGAMVWGKRGNDTPKPGRLLTILFFCTGLTALISYYVILLFPGLYKSMASAGISVSGADTIIFLLSVIILFIPSFFMGGIMPVISRIVILSKEKISSDLGRIYAFDTIGATTGGLITGFVLLGAFGQQLTFLTGVVISLLSAFMALMMSGKTEARKTMTDSDSTQKSKKIPDHEKDNKKNTQIALLSAFICGFTGLSLQIIWIRIFKIYLTNTSYTFSLITSMIILGLFTGSWLFKTKGKKISDLHYSMFKTLLIFGLLSFAGLLILINAPELFILPLHDTLKDPISRLILPPLTASLLVVFPPSVFSGYAFPMAIRILSSETGNISKNFGRILTWNTAGCVLGPVLSTFVLIPFLGVGISILLSSLILILSALYISFSLKHIKKISIYKNTIYLISIIFITVIILKPQIKIIPPSFSRIDRDILYYKETVEATLVVGKEKNISTINKITYVNNSAVIGSSYDAVKAVKMIGHLPFYCGLKCNNALIVGYGIGVTTSTVASHGEVGSIDCVELAGGLRESSRFYSGINNNVLRDPRLNFIPGDGRHYLQVTGKKYDLISSDPTHPVLGSGNLYSREYFELCKDHLNPGGMVSQYLPLHKLLPHDFLGIIKTFCSVFPGATVWLGHSHAILLGSSEPLKIDLEKWIEKVNSSKKDPLFYNDPYHIAVNLMFDNNITEMIPDNVKINTDNRSYVEFFSPSCFNPDNLIKNLKWMKEKRTDLLNVFYNITDKQLLNRYSKGNKLFIESLEHYQQGRGDLSLQKLKDACAANPENQEYPFLIKYYFTGKY